MKLSIIVPVYKVEPFLRRCVDSILAQTFTDFELILVDDGSPDSCPANCDEYAQLDTRVRVIHKINGGIADARNAGLDVAQGEYIGFVDSDDYISPDMYEILISKAEETNAENAAIGYIEVDKGGDIQKRCMNAEEDRVFRRDEFVDRFFPVFVGKLHHQHVIKYINGICMRHCDTLRTKFMKIPFLCFLCLNCAIRLR